MRVSGSPHPAAGDPFRDLLERRACALAEAAVQAEGRLGPEQIDDLTRLARLAEIRDAARLPPTRGRWPLVGLFGLTLLAVSLLLFVEMPETEIALDLKVSEVGFTMGRTQPLLDAMEVTALGIVGARAIELPPGLASAPGPADGAPVRVSGTTRGSRHGSLTLARVDVAANTRVWVRAGDGSQQFRLSLRGLDRPLHVTAYGPIRMDGAGLPPDVVDFASPRPITVKAGAQVLDLDLELPMQTSRAFSPQLRVQDLSLLRIEGFMSRESPSIQQRSTVLSGTIYFESLGGTPRSLRANERLRFERSEGEIPALRLGGGSIALDFEGRVRGMTSGSYDNPRSLMPSLLEWLRARQGLTLLWGTVVYALGVALAILRWWRSPT